jgi:hypothetical protein
MRKGWLHGHVRRQDYAEREKVHGFGFIALLRLSLQLHHK